MTLGAEIRRLRTKANVTLRDFAKRIDVSAPHLSDIENDRRRPSKALLERIVEHLGSVGATLVDLDKLDTRLDPETQAWATETPTAKMMLRVAREGEESNRPIKDMLKDLERILKEEREKSE